MTLNTVSRPLLATPAELAATDAGKARNDLVDAALHTAGLLRSTHDDAVVGESLVLLVSAAETYVTARRHLTALIAEENT